MLLPSLKPTQLGRLISDVAISYGLDPQFVAAVVVQESDGNPFAIRYEPAFYEKYIQGTSSQRMLGHVPKLCSLITEKNARATSWGLMQIMGQVARERGFKEDFLSSLIDPKTNLTVGVGFLKHLLDSRGSKEAALLKYNGGGDPKYAEKVLSHIHSGDAGSLLFS